MAKGLIVRTRDRVRVPFLRGILTRSLQQAGLDFEEAYGLASDVREAVKDRGEIESAELRSLVEQRLADREDDALRKYRTRRAVPPPIQVRYGDGHTSPFSRGRHRQTLSPVGLAGPTAGRVVQRVLERLAVDEVREIEAPALGRLTYELLRSEVNEEAAHRFAVWEEFSHSDRPLLLLVGGATGTGKSTVTALLSNRLEIVRAQSTDMLREVMRTMVQERLLPVLHRSSFEAWRALPERERRRHDPEALLVDGYRAQVELISVACEAVFERATRERVSLIMEGVHVHPCLLDRIPADGDAIVVPVMLAVLDPKRLRQHLRGRGKKLPGRRAKRYLQHFDAIWRLQTYLLAEADLAGVPIVTNDDMDEEIENIIGLVSTELAKHFEGDPDNVFV